MATRGPLLVLLESDDFARELYTDYLVTQGFRVRGETQLDDALTALRKGSPLLIAGISPGSVAIAELVARMRRVSPRTALMVILSRDASEGALRALREGALEALTAPVSADALAVGVHRCLETGRLLERLPEMRRHVDLYMASQRLQRTFDAGGIARELLDASIARVGVHGGLVVGATPGEQGAVDLLATHGFDDETGHELVEAWDPRALPTEEDRVLSFGPGDGPFARARVPGRLGTLVLRVGELGSERMWGALFVSKAAASAAGRDQPGAGKNGHDPDLLPDLTLLAEQASFALDSAYRFPDGAGEGSIDPLTDLFDEKFYMRTLEHEVSRKKKQGGASVALLAIDLDGFRQVNDTHGHLVGGRLLVEAARVLLRSVREVDVVARIGPDEFGVLLVSTELAGAVRTAERVRSAFAQHRFLSREGLDLDLSVAIGVAAFPQHGENASQLRDAAEEAARQAKKGKQVAVAGS
jgi:diguanylate cyclase (GGDEF)-like protein